jgi:hypothetical protein
MKKVLLSLLFIAALGTVASAQKGKSNNANVHGKVVSTVAKSNTTVNVNGVSTTKKHTGWTNGKHKGWVRKNKTKTAL